MDERDLRTMTVRELRLMLNKLPQDYKVYMSSDEEGNDYGTFDKTYSFQYDDDDKVITLVPFVDHLDDRNIMPKMMERFDKEFDIERIRNENISR